MLFDIIVYYPIQYHSSVSLPWSLASNSALVNVTKTSAVLKFHSVYTEGQTNVMGCFCKVFWHLKIHIFAWSILERLDSVNSVCLSFRVCGDVVCFLHSFHHLELSFEHIAICSWHFLLRCPVFQVNIVTCSTLLLKRKWKTRNLVLL